MTSILKRVSRNARGWVWPVAALSAAGAALYSPMRPLGLLPPDEAAFDLPGFILRAVLGFTIAWMAGWFSLPRMGARQFRYAFWTAAAFALTCVAGMELQQFGTLRAEAGAVLYNAVCWLGLTALGTVCGALLLGRAGGWLRRLNAAKFPRRLERTFPEPPPLGKRRFDRRLFFTGWLFILVCWTPVWLAYFPALGNYDLNANVLQCVSNVYNSHQSLAYTMLLKTFMKLGGADHTLAIGGLAVFQMLCFSAALAYSAAALRRLGARAWACLLALLCYAVFPVFPLMAVSTTKDVLFTAAATVAAVELLLMLDAPQTYLTSKGHAALFVASGAAMGLMRHNGVVSAGVFLAGFLLLWNRGRHAERKRFKGVRWKLAALLAAAMLLTTLGNQALVGLTGATSVDNGTLRDMASVPSQQMIRAALYTTDPEERESILRWYRGGDATAVYRPRLADFTKDLILAQNPQEWGAYLQTWLTVGLRHPKVYLEAFLELTRGLWFADDVSHTDIYTEDLATYGYLLNFQSTCEEHGYPITYNSLLPGLQSLLNDVTAQNAFLRWPVLRLAFSVGAQCWFTLLAFIVACYRRDRSAKWFAFWQIAILLVLLTAPAVLVRYVLPVFCCNPLLFALAAGRAEAARTHLK